MFGADCMHSFDPDKMTVSYTYNEINISITKTLQLTFVLILSKRLCMILIHLSLMNSPESSSPGVEKIKKCIIQSLAKGEIIIVISKVYV